MVEEVTQPLLVLIPTLGGLLPHASTGLWRVVGGSLRVDAGWFLAVPPKAGAHTAEPRVHMNRALIRLYGILYVIEYI